MRSAQRSSELRRVPGCAGHSVGLQRGRRGVWGQLLGPRWQDPSSRAASRPGATCLNVVTHLGAHASQCLPGRPQAAVPREAQAGHGDVGGPARGPRRARRPSEEGHVQGDICPRPSPSVTGKATGPTLRARWPARPQPGPLASPAESTAGTPALPPAGCLASDKIQTIRRWSA